MNHPATTQEAIRYLKDALRYLGAYYGGTFAHHLISLKGEGA
jgi:hypothetical protein